MRIHYKMVIEWSDEDQCYITSLPDFGPYARTTHGDTYQESVKNGEEVLELLKDSAGGVGPAIAENAPLDFSRNA